LYKQFFSGTRRITSKRVKKKDKEDCNNFHFIFL
jgi:hypothetical protein